MRKFITHNAETITRMRKHRACPDCRRKKRRCDHISSPGSSRAQKGGKGHAITSPYPPTTETNKDPSIFSPDDAIPAEGSAPTIEQQHIYSYPERLPTIHLGESSRDIHLTEHLTESDYDVPSAGCFIGDLNPEGVFYSATNPESTTRGMAARQSIGTWLAEKLKSNQDQQQAPLDTSEGGIFYGSSSSVGKMLLPLLQEEVVGLLPREPYYSQLLVFYQENIHPLLPIIDIRAIRSSHLDHKSKVLLTQAMCLLSSMNHACKSLLYLHGDLNLLTPREFGRRLLSAMRCAVEIGTVSNKMVLIQALGPMSLFTEGANGPEISTQLCAKMIQVVHTVGIQHQRGDELENTQEVTVLCCAWALDRLNAAIHGRPIIMHHQDIGRNLDMCFESQQPVFRMLLRILVQLDEVIALYRPRADPDHAKIEVEFPSFEDILVRSKGTNLPVKFLSMLTNEV